MDEYIKQELKDKATSPKAHKITVAILAGLVVFLFLIMQVRVGDKDNRIGDLVKDNRSLSAELRDARDHNEAVASEVKRLDRNTQDLVELQGTTVAWGVCLEKWGTELSQGLDSATVTKVRCDTILAEMNIKAGK